MKKFLGLLFAVLTCCSSLLAGPMEDLNNQLNDIEQEFWAALASPIGSDYYNRFDESLKKFVFKCQDLQMKLKRDPRNFKLPNITSPAITLTRTFSTVNRSTLIKFGHRRYNQKRTNFYNYKTEFTRLERARILAEKEAEKEADYESDSSTSKSRKSKRKRSRISSTPRYPSLSIININAYASWINDVKAANISSVISSGRGRKKDAGLRNLAEKYSSFMNSIADLRIAIAIIRQQGKGF